MYRTLPLGNRLQSAATPLLERLLPAAVRLYLDPSQILQYAVTRQRVAAHAATVRVGMSIMVKLTLPYSLTRNSLISFLPTVYTEPKV